MGIKSKLESCNTTNDVVGVLEEHRGLLCKAFGLGEVAFRQGVEKLKAL